MRATAWILDVGHRAKTLSCDVPAERRALAAVHDAAQRELGLALPGPAGARNVRSAAEFLFVLPRAGEGDGWSPLPTWAGDDARAFSLYVDALLGGWQPPTRALDVFCFGDTPELAAALGHLVTKGVKRGSTSWLRASEREGAALPVVGGVSIVTDGFGYPLCAIRTDKVERLAFQDLTEAHAWVEGEGDRTLEDYREGHLRYFHREAERYGLTFREDETVLFEHFRVLAILGRADP